MNQHEDAWYAPEITHGNKSFLRGRNAGLQDRESSKANPQMSAKPSGLNGPTVYTWRTFRPSSLVIEGR
jgi:hypothetical protein